MITFLYYLLFGIISFYLGANYKRILLALIRIIKKKEKEDKIKEEGEEEVNEKYDFDDADLKMVFLVREDLKLGAGKIAAQVAHAAVGLYSEITLEGKSYYQQALEHWDEFGAKKIVLKAKDLDEMREVHKECKKRKIPSIMISDAGHTQVDPGTKTVLGIGPEASEKLDKITGKFKLMR
jgi:PTH2 family peptidyl-tRNA hydrolase